MSTAQYLRTMALFFATGVVVILFASSAYVYASHHGTGNGKKMHTFADIDLNEDGAIVAEEFYKARANHMAERAAAGGKMKNAANAPTFESIDSDGDGEISPQEFAAHQGEMRARHRGSKAQQSQ